MSKIIIEKISSEKKKALMIPDTCSETQDWSVWECAASTFDWSYPSQEVAYVFEGKVNVKTHDGEVEINKGDLVTFPKGLSCTWHIIEPIRKVYKME